MGVRILSIRIGIIFLNNSLFERTSLVKMQIRKLKQDAFENEKLKGSKIYIEPQDSVLLQRHHPYTQEHLQQQELLLKLLLQTQTQTPKTTNNNNYYYYYDDEEEHDGVDNNNII